MKKIYFIVFMALVAITHVANAAQPGPLTAKLLTGTVPTIDGDGTDAAWATATAQPINVIFKDETTGFGVAGSGDLDATFKVLESGKMLYFLFKVDDEVICQDPNAHWAGDKVEIYFGLPGYVNAAGANKAHSRQFAVKAQDDVTKLGENGSNNYAPASDALATNGVKYGYTETLTGYIIEISIDRAIALENVPASTIAFDVCIADNDEGAGKTGIRYRKSWFNTGAIHELWANMTETGSLVLNVATETTSVNNVKENISLFIQNNILNVNTVENVQLAIYDIAGKRVMQTNNSNKVNISALNAGVYFANIKSTQGILIRTIRFVK